MSLAGRRAMVVDDSVIAASKLRVALESLGHTVVGSAASGADAPALYRDLRPDFVTMDIVMPDMDGVQATREILSEFPDAVVIMVTSLGQERMVMDALKAGALGYIVKPIKAEAISSTLDRLTSRFENR
ncbi:response regulator [Roseospira visakhapatnamensis]|uniref:Two-component system chemotaxis response regulator CheY n=1 Tax=Roseospira visakhapatnamensis TaxID=390880 RepID=A0A7W6RDY1_9PROT|nr:response regulator [Roseospira visakhapatnamensis]MBB4266771.1 two-component system chemotaxis response regulator CheY [Roseospira visakhapatnamensis]